MTQSAFFSVVQLGTYPGTRSLGQDGRSRLDDLLLDRRGVDLTIGFDGVEVMNISFTDEFLGKFLTSHDFAAGSNTVKVSGLNSDNLYSVAVCVERRETAVAALGPEGTLTLLGDGILADTFEEALRLASFKATDLADAMELTPQNANNRLKRLAAVGALRKTQVTGSNRGGKEFRYEVVTAQLPDLDHLALA